MTTLLAGRWIGGVVAPKYDRWNPVTDPPVLYGNYWVTVGGFGGGPPRTTMAIFSEGLWHNLEGGHTLWPSAWRPVLWPSPCDPEGLG